MARKKDHKPEYITLIRRQPSSQNIHIIDMTRSDWWIVRSDHGNKVRTQKIVICAIKRENAWQVAS